MSELKIVKQSDVQWGHWFTEYYLKTEADKVIAHHKYKRCLAMARWCDEVMMSCELRGYNVHRIWAQKHKWAMRWKYKWLELSEKFKEAK